MLPLRLSLGRLPSLVGGRFTTGWRATGMTLSPLPYEPLQREAESLNVHTADIAGWPEWQQEAQRLEKAGRAIFADDDTYGAYLDAIAAGKPRLRLTLDQWRSRIDDAHVKATKAEQGEPLREPAPRQE